MSDMRSERNGALSDWLVVGTSTVCLAVSVIHIYALGVFLLPIEQELKLSRAEITSGLALVSLVSVICAPFIGSIIDRFGSRAVAIPGIIIYCAAIAGLASASGSVANWWALWLVVAAGSILIKITVWMTAIAKRFDKRRGLAFAIALSGTGIGAAILPRLSAELIEVLGWRHAYIALAGGGLLLALPLLLTCFREAKSPGLAARREEAPGFGVAEGLRSPEFLHLAIASVIGTLTVLGMSVHFVPIMVSRGMEAGSAASIAGVLGVSSIIGRLSAGAMLDRLSGAFVGAAGLALPFMAALLILGFDGSTFSAIAIAALIGVALGAETDVIAFLAARHFGLRNYGTLFGTLAGLLSLGAGLGPFLAGWVYDRYGSYDPMLWAILPLSILGSLCLARMRRYAAFEAR